MTEFLNYTPAALVALTSFAFVSSITPGPNNLMLLHSGARFGFRPTFPHLMGVNLGFGLMLLLCCLGVAAVILAVPATQLALKVLGCAYMLWLAYKLWKNGALPVDGHLPEAKNSRAARPFTFTQAALFQYVNPKAWMMGLSVPATFLPHNGTQWLNASVASTLFVVINFFCLLVWVQGGVVLQKLMHRPDWARVINWVIVALTLYCAVSVWL
jgi:threonine/homoserine/homoserine lactone efflux protein